MLCVPAAPPTGPVPDHPVVAVNTTHWWKDPQFLAAAGGAVVAFVDPIVEVLVTGQPIRWRSLVLSGLLGLVAWLRKQTNTVTT